MGDWQRLSVRRGLAVDDGPYEGVPNHLRAPIMDWLEHALTKVNRQMVARPGQPLPRSADLELTMKVAVAARVGLPQGDVYAKQSHLLAVCGRDSDTWLDVLDAVLHLAPDPRPDALKGIFDEGASVWTVKPDGKGLEEKVGESAALAFEDATSPEDLASTDLRHAWSRAYGRHFDASDAWDHAIKAVEAVLAPIVVPAQDQPHLGHVLGQLRGQPGRWRFVLPGPAESHSVGPLVSMLDMLWPNPDRHASGNPRTPSLEEARAAVHLAVLIVQWARAGALSPSS